jgi:hypothetical protein
MSKACAKFPDQPHAYPSKGVTMHQIGCEEVASSKQLPLPFSDYEKYFFKIRDGPVSQMGVCPFCGYGPLSVKPNHLQYCPFCKQYCEVNTTTH